MLSYAYDCGQDIKKNMKNGSTNTVFPYLESKRTLHINKVITAESKFSLELSDVIIRLCNAV